MKILIADDHPLYREALATALSDLGESVEILEAGTFNEVAAHSAATTIDLILLDLYMSGGEWGAVIAELRRQHPDTPVIVISASDSRGDMERAMSAGAFGYIPKSLAKEEILSAIHLMMSGSVTVQPRSSEDSGDREVLHLPTRGHDRDMETRIAKLTPRQRDVLREIAAGNPNKLIARALGMTEGTVKLHVAAILKCLGVPNRTQAAIIANRLDRHSGGSQAN